MGSDWKVDLSETQRWEVLILVVMEYGLRQTRTSFNPDLVLILVVMEYGLRQTLKVMNNYKKS